MTAVSLVLLEHDDDTDNDIDNDNNFNAANNDKVKDNARVVEHQIEGYSYSPIGKVHGIPSNIEVKEQPLGSVADVAAVSALCNNAKIVGHDHDHDADDAVVDTAAVTDGIDKMKKKKKKKKGKDHKKERKSYERVGEPTEAALCVLAEKLGGMSRYLDDSDNDSGGALVGNTARRLDHDGGLHIHIPPSVLASANVQSWRREHERIAMLEFHRDRKSMSVLCSFPQGDYPTTANAIHAGTQGRPAGNRLLVKGAPNLLLERCTRVKFRDGTVAKLTGPLRRALEEKISELAARPLRCLALAVKEGSQLEESLQSLTDKDASLAQHPLLSDADNYKNIESGLTLVGIVGIKDPARPEVADSIDLCTKAGIRVMMITGDARDTAVAIARDVHIFPPDSKSNENLKAFEGREFFNKPEHEQLQLLKEGNIVFCRAEPADKQKLVKMLQSLKEIPAMTGDVSSTLPLSACDE
jgi:P-type Ca2+ transporter type 2C